MVRDTRPLAEGYLLEYFYIDPKCQGKGIGDQVLEHFLTQDHVAGSLVTLNVLQGSSARRLYERFGFKVDREDSIDIFMSMIVGL
ncbi:Acetyltransferase (GNAT) family protein [compost metagenome]